MPICRTERWPAAATDLGVAGIGLSLAQAAWLVEAVGELHRVPVGASLIAQRLLPPIRCGGVFVLLEAMGIATQVERVTACELRRQPSGSLLLFDAAAPPLPQDGTSTLPAATRLALLLTSDAHGVRLLPQGADAIVRCSHARMGAIWSGHVIRTERVDRAPA